jgi:nucleoside-diphosphate-sugar epimerase
MIGIFGAGGSIGQELARNLVQAGTKARLVSRNPTAMGGGMQPAGSHSPNQHPSSLMETFAADLSDPAQAIRAAEGCEVVFLLVGLKYNLAVWRDLWPRIMRNTIEACRQAGAKLVFFDNVYMYGGVDGPMTEQTPFHPISQKGEIRARIATELIDTWTRGEITALIARSADFYGPGADNSVLNRTVFENFAKGKSALWLCNDQVPHSFTYTPDAARALGTLIESPEAWNQTWHLPTASPALTGKQWVERIAEEFGVKPKYRVMGRTLLRIAGWADSDIRESIEMLYQNDSPYVFDSSKFEAAFGVTATSPEDGIRITAQNYGRS